MQWMTDYVPLATPSSKLANQSVLFFELLRYAGRSRVTARLAVTTKQNILLYETIRGERAFRFVKVRLIIFIELLLDLFFFRNFIPLYQHGVRHSYTKATMNPALGLPTHSTKHPHGRLTLKLAS